MVEHTEYRGITDGFTLKAVALLFMIMDHVHVYLGIFPEWFSLFPRFVAPLFVFFLVEGFFHTRSRSKYLIRLYIAAAVMWCGNILINLAFHNVNRQTGQMDFFSLIAGNNILWTLAILFSVLCLLEKFKKENGTGRIIPLIAAILLMAFALVGTEGGLYLVPVLLICYVFYGKPYHISIGILLWSVLLLAKACYSYASAGMTGAETLFDYLCFDNEWMLGMVVLPILLYNGRRGWNAPAAKWMFYIIYPLHLWILMSINFIAAR